MAWIERDVSVVGVRVETVGEDGDIAWSFIE